MDPAQFLDAVAGSVHVQIEEGMKEFKTSLVNVIAEKKLDKVSEGRLNETCELINDRVNEVFDKNLEKFKIYAMRNIFVPTSQSAESTISSSSSKISTETDEELNTLRKQYLALQAEHRELADNCRDTDLLLKDMRSALFTLRVGAQTFEDIQPIAETVANITQNREKLQQMCIEANAIIDKFSDSSASTTSEKGQDQPMEVVPDVGDGPIATRDVEDIMALGRSLRGK